MNLHPNVVPRHSWIMIDYDLHEPQNAQHFKILAPDFARKFGHQDKPRFANKLVLRVYGGEEPFAEAMPEAAPELERTFELIGQRGLRFSKRGPIHLAHY